MTDLFLKKFYTYASPVQKTEKSFFSDKDPRNIDANMGIMMKVHKSQTAKADKIWSDPAREGFLKFYNPYGERRPAFGYK